jgi:hypothetical protein
MATAKFSRSARPRGRAGGNHPRAHSIVPIRPSLPATIGEIIRRECRRLQKAVAVLKCMQTAAEYEVEADIADVAAVACDLVGQALYEFDLAGRNDPSGLAGPSHAVPARFASKGKSISRSSRGAA